MCDRLMITGADAVSCLINGLPESIWANAYAANCGSPEALYNTFLAGLDNFRPKAIKMERPTVDSRAGHRRDT